MKNAPMRFAGMSLHHNPHQLTLSCSENLCELVSPCCEPDSLSLGAKLYRIAGEGELYGSDCLAQYQNLDSLRQAHRREKLVLPRMEPMYAYLKELSMKAQPQEDVIQYRFVFTQAQSDRKTSRPRYYLTDNTEILWDVSRTFGVAVEELVALNPSVKNIDSLDAGMRVRLC